MSDDDLWQHIKSVSEENGISEGNFNTMKSRGRLAKKHVTPIYLSLKAAGKPVKLEHLHRLSKSP